MYSRIGTTRTHATGNSHRSSLCRIAWIPPIWRYKEQGEPQQVMERVVERGSGFVRPKGGKAGFGIKDPGIVDGPAVQRQHSQSCQTDLLPGKAASVG